MNRLTNTAPTVTHAGGVLDRGWSLDAEAGRRWNRFCAHR